MSNIRAAQVQILARRCARKKRWDRASALYRQLVGLDPLRQSAWTQLGHAAKEHGDLDGAAEAYEVAARLSPQDPQALLHIGHLSRMRGDEAAAVSAFRAALKLNNSLDDAADALTVLGHADEVRRIRDGEDLQPLLDRIAEIETAAVREMADRSNGVDHILGTLRILETANATLSSRLDRMDERFDHASRQMGTLLEHISIAKSLGFEIVRLKHTSTSGTAALWEKVTGLEAGLDDRLSIVDSHLTSLGELHNGLGAVIADIAKLDAKLGTSERAISALSRMASDNQHQPAASDDIPAIADTVAAMLEQIGNQEQTLRFLLGRVEFVRREILFEIKYGPATEPNVNEPLTVETHIVNAAKLAAARAADDIRLNIGCGHIPEDGYLNIDSRAIPGIDIVAEATALPFEPETVVEIRSSHLLEHFPEQAAIRTLLPHWISKLKPGGRLLSIVPDGEAMARGYADETYPFALFREVLFGAQDYAGDFHYNMFTPKSLADLLASQGLVNIRLIDAGRRNGDCFEFEIEAFRPATGTHA